MHPAESAANRGKWDELIESFKVHDIAKYMNMSFTDWVAQPADLVSKQIKAAIRWKEQELREVDSRVSQLVDITGKPFSGNSTIKTR